MDKLKAIEAFERVARLGTLAKAAQDLQISRPMVSFYLKQLEDHLGVRLVNRTTRQLSLTEAGREYLDFCSSILTQFEQQEAHLSELHLNPRGSLHIVSSLAFGNFQLAPIVSEFSQLYPELLISLIVTDNFVAKPVEADLKYDVAILMRRPEDAGTSIVTRIGEVRWILCGSRAYIESREPILHPSDLSKHNCLVHRSLGPSSSWRFQQGDQFFDVQVRGGVFSNSVMVLKSATMHGVGVAMLPHYAVKDELTNGALTPLLPSFIGFQRSVYAVYPHQIAPKKTRMFIDFARRALRKIEKEQEALF
ncbi:MAG: LysR substrate-binding domain-containing protein [Beijerinckiaceae bacterium]